MAAAAAVTTGGSGSKNEVLFLSSSTSLDVVCVGSPEMEAQTTPGTPVNKARVSIQFDP